MTEIRMERRGCRMLVSASGHAEGSVEACAGVSAILYALYGYLHGNGKAAIYRQRLESGDAILEFSGGADVAAAFEMTSVGLRQIAKGYPAYVQVRETE